MGPAQQPHSIFVLSARGRISAPAQCCVNEFEDVLADTIGATLVCPGNALESVAFVERVPAGPADLFVVGLTIAHVVETLKRARGWRRRFRRVYAYVFDSIFPSSEIERSAFRRSFSRFSRTVSALDHLFLSCRSAVEIGALCYGIPVSYVPLAADVEKFGSMQPSRPITVNAYGRQQTAHLQVLADAYNRNDTDRSVHFTSHLSGMVIADPVRHRAFFWKMLAMSRIALAYDILQVGGGRKLPYTFVGQRWFESLAAGCVVVGYRPKCAEAEELLNWPDATIESPEEPAAFLRFIENLLADHSRLDAIRVSNYCNMAAAHDWGHRIELMLQALELEPADALRRRILRLERLARSSAAETLAA